MKINALTPRLVVLIGMLMLATGCQSRTHRSTLEMPTNNVATASMKGSSTLLTVSNKGPGSVYLSVDGENSIEGNQIELTSGSLSETIHVLKLVKLETGADSPAIITLQIQQSGGVKLGGPRPK